MARDRDDVRLANEIWAQRVVGRGDERRVEPAAAALALERMSLSDETLPAEERGVGEEMREAVHLEDVLETRRVRALGQPDAARLDAGAAARGPR